MKLHFEPNLDYQLQAIESVCDLFRGQEICRTEFTVTMKLPDQQLTLGVADTDKGLGNRLTLVDDQLLDNLRNVQLRNGLAPSSTLASGDFTVEMETGTGKTYVYLRTIFELNKRYGFTKFVIVVPSVAIKEGVYKSLQITEEHFKSMYAGVPVDFFLYDSSKLGQVRNFATSATIQIMVVTVGAINKKEVNNLYKDSEKTGGEKPIDLIRATRPIVIVDEPQSVDGGLSGAGKAALDAMNPLCTLRYSATHANKHHMVYRLDAVDAYERKLVKQIEVAAATIEDAFNKPYVRLLEVSNKKGRWADPELDKEGGLKNETSRADAERGYNLIMKEKEKLLSFGTPLKFIFSHSALKEGWDNPNVFQICALREMGSERERRQTLGRGLRLCVNQDGQRVYGHDVNRLTVIATESYQEFADQLQKEIEADTGIRFGIVEQHQFATIAITTPDGKVAPLGVDQSKALWDHLRAAGHIDAKGKVQDSLKVALKDGKLDLPEAFEPYRGQVAELLRKVTGRVEVKNRDDRETVPLRKGADGKAVTLSEDFKALWDRIKHKTTYRVQFDNDKLIRDCTAALTRDLHIARARLQWRKAEIGIGKAGVEAREKEGAYTVTLDEADIELPDLLTDLQDRTQLTRRTLVKVLTECERLDDFKRNPQQFIEQAAEIINRCKRMALVDGIRYQRLGDDVWKQELFETEELTGYLTNMLRDTKRSIYEHVVYDSATERDFADALEKDEDVVLYAKLPGWFKVPTPLGSYNPDWAVLINKDGARRLYFVVETKSSLFTDDLRNKESAKIECGKAHFKALAVGENPARYLVARSLSDLQKLVE